MKMNVLMIGFVIMMTLGCKVATVPAEVDANADTNIATPASQLVEIPVTVTVQEPTTVSDVVATEPSVSAETK
jgi:hypothetical protein